jgi:hypothetical protein
VLSILQQLIPCTLDTQLLLLLLSTWLFLLQCHL